MSVRQMTMADPKHAKEQSLLEDGPAPEAGAVLEVSGLSKAFGPVQALRACSLTLRRAEIHAVLGENGSGKSTLVKILSGVQRPDAGVIRLDGNDYAALRTPRTAQLAGVATVFQEVLTVGPRSVLDNIWLGHEGTVRQKTPLSERSARARDLLGELVEPVPSLETPAEELSLSLRQTCVVARALLHESRVLILDEATSALDVATRDRLFKLLRRLAESGTAILFISHRMDEIKELADRVTVMRSGAAVGTGTRDTLNGADLVRLMTGAESLTGAEHVRAKAAGSATRIAASGVRLAGAAAAFDVEIRAGEIVGVAGLEGHGQELFLHALWGEGREGDVRIVAGESMKRLSSKHQAAAHGVVYVPRDRGAESLFRNRSILDNFALPTLRRDRRARLWAPRRSAKRFTEYARRLGVVHGGHRDPIATLSGGNQQKIVMARWLASDPVVLLLNDPTRGIDMGAKHDMYALLRELAEEGLSVVMLSTELDELLELTDRVLVFRDHELFAEFESSELSRERLVGAFFGQTDGNA
jgi:ABC-type sugar transport system ATPase subunit